MFALRAGLPFRWSFTSSTYINGMRLLSSAAKAANPPNHTVYLRCQHPSKDTILTVSQVRDKASSYGQVQRIDLARSKTAAFVQFASFEEAAKLYEAHTDAPFPYSDTISLYVEYAHQRDLSESSAEPSDTLFISQVPTGVTASHIKDAFTDYGNVKTVLPFVDTALVTFDDAASAAKARDAQIQIQGQPVQIGWAINRTEPSRYVYCKTMDDTGSDPEKTLREMLDDVFPGAVDSTIKKIKLVGVGNSSSTRAIIRFANIEDAKKMYGARTIQGITWLSLPADERRKGKQRSVEHESNRKRVSGSKARKEGGSGDPAVALDSQNDSSATNSRPE